MLLNELTNCVFYHGYKNKDIFKTANTKIKKNMIFFDLKNSLSVLFIAKKSLYLHCKTDIKNGHRAAV